MINLGDVKTKTLSSGQTLLAGHLGQVVTGSNDFLYES